MRIKGEFETVTHRLHRLKMNPKFARSKPPSAIGQ